MSVTTVQLTRLGFRSAEKEKMGTPSRDKLRPVVLCQELTVNRSRQHYSSWENAKIVDLITLK